MARVKTARTTRARHKKVLKQAKGYYGAKSYRFRNAKKVISENYGLQELMQQQELMVLHTAN